MKLAGIFVVGTILFSLCAQSADAYYGWRRPVVYYDAQEIGRQQRLTLQEKTHQMKEMEEYKRMHDTKQRISAATTTKEYGVPMKPQRQFRKRNNAALVHKQNAKRNSQYQYLN